MNPPSISVLMSVRNGLPYLPETVRSILAQTFTDFEFIIVDNASTDGSVGVIEEIARTEPRIRLVRNETDLGHSGGLNRGLEFCCAPWVARSSSTTTMNCACSPSATSAACPSRATPSRR